MDLEIQKIITESLQKAKKDNFQKTIINPLNDLKKKDLEKAKDSTKIKLITKQSNKIIVKEVEKTNI